MPLHHCHGGLYRAAGTRHMENPLCVAPSSFPPRELAVLKEHKRGPNHSAFAEVLSAHGCIQMQIYKYTFSYTAPFQLFPPHLAGAVGLLLALGGLWMQGSLSTSLPSHRTTKHLEGTLGNGMRLAKRLNYSKLINYPVQMAPTMNTIKEKKSG